MDNYDLRKKDGFIPDFGLGLMLTAAAFAVGCCCTALLRMAPVTDVMSIGMTEKAAVWIALAAFLSAESACIVMPAARVLSILLSAVCGAAAACISYMYSSLKLFSSEFFAFAAVIFTLSAAVAYVSDRVFVLSPKLRSVIRTDRRLRRELNIFCAVSSALALAAIAAAAAFILL